jgi:NADPH-dependent 2,4-dienoyl-CoA reductase/sulfur reductase-like enzyme
MDSARAIYEYLHPEATASFEREGYGAGSAVTDYADTAAPESVAVIGGGYIGIEMAEAFEANGLDVHLFEMLPHVLAPFGEAAASIVESHLVERGVDLHLETAVTGFDGTDRIEAVRTDAGEFPVDMALVGVGVEPRVELAVGAGLDLGTTGAIRTDEYGRTNDDRVFAAGDCAENHHVVTDDPAYVPLALTANRAGRAIGATVAGSPMRAGSIAGTAIVKAFDLEVSRTGLIDHDEARAEGFDPVSKTITDSSRAGYYPGTEDITVTLCADRESHRVLGASIVGRDQAGKRIDAVATALHAELTVLELQNLDLAYAPPFGPVWDPVLTAARVLGGALDGSP